MTATIETRLNPRSVQSIIRRYKAGDSSVILAADYCVSPPAIIALLRRANVKIKTRGRYPQ